MFSNKFATIFTALVAAAAAVGAAPADVIAPPVTAPKAGDLWTVGSKQVVTWDASSIPSNTTETGVAFLGFLEDGSDDEHIDTKNPLATGFPITSGSVTVTVPDVTPRDDYIVVLVGDSGDVSGKFTITN
ncbi:hypothetical protein TRAPUB_2190 [Trametes pubescens]|uniref:Yeast cell wall synthesis Kre9/Knh1-like N-terminal domain-containing protein n=1 Tax=Trametes pubescens TaxID=154538 RepID=A0A1M2VHC2_TRAPU|nr:hypothetical protein TRAPUB_2190 [Trametes pubescens]